MGLVAVEVAEAEVDLVGEAVVVVVVGLAEEVEVVVSAEAVVEDVEVLAEAAGKLSAVHLSSKPVFFPTLIWLCSRLGLIAGRQDISVPTLQIRSADIHPGDTRNCILSSWLLLLLTIPDTSSRTCHTPLGDLQWTIPSYYSCGHEKGPKAFQACHLLCCNFFLAW